MASSWPLPKFGYAQHVKIMPLEGMEARVTDLLFFGSAGIIRYEVRYFHEGKEYIIKVFEDELEDNEGKFK